MTLLPVMLVVWLFAKSQLVCQQPTRRPTTASLHHSGVALNDITEDYSSAAAVAFQIDLAEKLFQNLRFYPIGCTPLPVPPRLPCVP